MDERVGGCVAHQPHQALTMTDSGVRIIMQLYVCNYSYIIFFVDFWLLPDSSLAII